MWHIHADSVPNKSNQIYLNRIVAVDLIGTGLRLVRDTVISTATERRRPSSC
jgi:hypothetical protein